MGRDRYIDDKFNVNALTLPAARRLSVMRCFTVSPSWVIVFGLSRTSRTSPGSFLLQPPTYVLAHDFSSSLAIPPTPQACSA